MSLPERARCKVSRFEKGQSMAEYAIIVAAIAITVYAAYQFMASNPIYNLVVTTIGGWLSGA